ncbi:MAG TPA: hypothetical protein VFQ53_36840 [Kofleriaceae bacterium]|nr:hypothetical protein [Kofleriaceae bacterium]
MTARSAEAKPVKVTAFFIVDTPRNPCDARPPEPRCVAGHRAEWRKLVAGTHPVYKHRTTFPRSVVWCGTISQTCKAPSPTTPASEEGWSFVIVVPDPPSQKLSVRIGGVAPVEDKDLYPRWTSPIGSLVIHVGMPRRLLEPGTHAVVLSAGKQVVFEGEVVLD